MNYFGVNRGWTGETCVCGKPIHESMRSAHEFHCRRLPKWAERQRERQQQEQRKRAERQRHEINRRRYRHPELYSRELLPLERAAIMYRLAEEVWEEDEIIERAQEDERMQRQSQALRSATHRASRAKTSSGVSETLSCFRSGCFGVAVKDYCPSGCGCWLKIYCFVCGSGGYDVELVRGLEVVTGQFRSFRSCECDACRLLKQRLRDLHRSYGGEVCNFSPKLDCAGFLVWYSCYRECDCSGKVCSNCDLSDSSASFWRYDGCVDGRPIGEPFFFD